MALSLGFDDRGGVHARPRTEGIGADDWVVHRNWHADRIGDEPAVLGQLADIVAMRPQQLQVHEQEVHFRIANPLADAQRRRMHPIHPRLDRSETVDQPHPAITMAVPINFYRILLDDFLLDEFYQRLYAVRRRMPDRIRETNPSGAARNRGTVQGFDRFRTRAGGILGHV